MEKNSSKEYCSWEEIEYLTKVLADKIRRYDDKAYDTILAVTNGGIIPARLMARELKMDHIQLMPIRNKKLFKEEMLDLSQQKKYLIIDEICDTGDTVSKIYEMVMIFNCDFAFLMSRHAVINNQKGRTYVGKILNHNKWVVFPWE